MASSRFWHGAVARLFGRCGKKLMGRGADDELRHEAGDRGFDRVVIARFDQRGEVIQRAGGRIIVG